MSTLNTANIAALLSSGQNPVWTKQVSLTSEIPSTINAGVSVSQSLRSQLEVSLRRKAHIRSAILTPIAFDAATSYRVVISGTLVSASGASLDAMLAALASAINVHAVANLVVTATAVDATLAVNAGSNTLLLIEGLSEDDWYFDFSVLGGTGTALGSADGVTAILNVYMTGGGTTIGSGRWVKVNNISGKIIDSGGFIERFDVAGADRVSAHLIISGLNVDGASVTFDSQVMHGPSV